MHLLHKCVISLLIRRGPIFYFLQILKIAKEGADLVRLTVQGRFEADACMKIRETLWSKNCDIPLVADIHFSPAVALRVADAFEKIRSYESRWTYQRLIRCV